MITNETQALKTAVLICAHALRLNTTLPLADGAEWPYDPWSVMKRVHCMMKDLALQSPSICAALVILDEKTEEDILIDQEALINRLEKLTSQMPQPLAG